MPDGVEGVLELEQSVLLWPSGRDHQWMLNQGGNFAQGQDIITVLKYLLTDYLLLVREKIIIFHWRN